MAFTFAALIFQKICRIMRYVAKYAYFCTFNQCSCALFVKHMLFLWTCNCLIFIYDICNCLANFTTMNTNTVIKFFDCVFDMLKPMLPCFIKFAHFAFVTMPVHVDFVVIEYSTLCACILSEFKVAIHTMSTHFLFSVA